MSVGRWEDDTIIRAAHPNAIITLVENKQLCSSEEGYS
jgi:hypothetical protein